MNKEDYILIVETEGSARSVRVYSKNNGVDVTSFPWFNNGRTFIIAGEEDAMSMKITYSRVKEI